MIAYVESRHEPGGRAPDRIVVRSISTGRVLHQGSLYVATAQHTMVEEARAVRIAVESDGAVAFIQEDSFIRHGGAAAPPVVYDLFAIDRTGFHSLKIDLPTEPRSLRLAGNILFWTEQGTSQAAILN